MKVTVERQHAGSAAAIFSRLVDLSSIRRLRGFDEATYLDGEEPGPGARFVTVDPWMFQEKGNPGRFIWRVTAYEEGVRFASEMESTGASFDFVLVPNAKGCLIRLTRDDRPDASDAAFDRLVYHLIALIPPLARKGALADAEKDINRI